MMDHRSVLVSDFVNEFKQNYAAKIFTRIKDLLFNVLGFIYDILKVFLNVSKFYLCWIIIHYIASQLYIQLCTPWTFYGFVLSPFLTLTPHCQGLRWIVYNGAGVINNMWFIFGSWLCANVFILKH